ncbi:hypothetical protein XENTR_v10012318 [Xenopus tropicalis]|nr:hypothetical protein XENTR_v10012318 [Xenopus tropicalis]
MSLNLGSESEQPLYSPSTVSCPSQTYLYFSWIYSLFNVRFPSVQLFPLETLSSTFLFLTGVLLPFAAHILKLTQ